MERAESVHFMMYFMCLSCHTIYLVSKATKKGVTVSFDDTKCFILDKNEEIVAGVRKGRLYCLECESIPYCEKVNVVETKHQRYGHLEVSTSKLYLVVMLYLMKL